MTVLFIIAVIGMSLALVNDVAVSADSATYAYADESKNILADVSKQISLITLQIQNLADDQYDRGYADVSKQISLITLQIQNLADDQYDRGYADGLNDRYNPRSEPTKDDSNSITNHYPNYNNPDFDYYPNYNNPDFDYYPNYNNPDFDYYPKYDNPNSNDQSNYKDPIIQYEQEEFFIDQCLNEDGYFVDPSIDVSASVKNNVLKVRGSGIQYDANFDNQAVISLSPINDYDGTKNIHLVKVKASGIFAGTFDVDDVFYDDYTYGNTKYAGNIDSSDNYKIEIQYDDQCGFTELNYDYQIIPTRPVNESIDKPTKPINELKSIEVPPYKIPLPFSNGNFADAHRSHAEIITIDVNVSCLDGKSPCFIPDKVTIPVGGEVIFVVNDGYGHVIAQGTDRSKPHDGEFRVDNLVKGGQFSHVFYNAGEYPYFSTIENNANGIIIVE